MAEFTSQLTGAKARAKILAGVNKVYDVVKLTLGPEGRNALLPRTYNRGPRITNDGVTVSENILLKDEHERLAAEAFKEGSKKTNELVGDGTTGTAVIGGHLINKIFKSLDDSETPLLSSDTKVSISNKGVRALRKELKDAKDLVIQKIKDKAIKVSTLEELEEIAVVSIGKEDEEIAKTIAEMVWHMGVDNHIDVLEGYKSEIETEITKGMRMPMKVPAKAFVNNAEKYEMVAEDMQVLITDYVINSVPEITAILNPLKLNKIAIVAKDFSDEVLIHFVKSKQATGYQVFPIKCPALRTEQLEDLAIYTGANFISKKEGNKLTKVTLMDLGFAEKIIVKDTENKEDAVIIGGNGEKIKGITTEGELNTKTPIEQRIEVLKEQIKESKNELNTIVLQKRIANLSSAVGVIRVGATTSKEGLFLKLKIEDGVYACKAALQDGFVKGGGLCLKEIAEELPENILTETLKEPYEQIQRNAGGNLEIGEDIIDPAKVVMLEIEHGVSIAASMITCDITIPEVREKSPAEGYEEIAKAIKMYCYLFAKQHGIIKENENEQQSDMEKEFERIMLSDK